MSRAGLIFRRARIAVLALLPACGGGTDAAPGLPAAAARVPGNAFVASWRDPAQAGSEADLLPVGAVARLLEDAGITLRDDVEGFVYAQSDEVVTGWSSLADSALFQDAWAARPDVTADRWVYGDLQCAVDLALLRLTSTDRRARRVVDALALPTLEWAIAGIRSAGRDTVIDGRIRSTGASVGLVALVGPPAAASLLGPLRDSDRLRVELRVDPVVTRRMTDVWLTSDLRTGSAIDALATAFGPMLRNVIRHFDGQLSLRIDAGGGFVLAAGIRDGDGEALADTLDRYLPEAGSYRWLLSGGLVASIDGARLLVLDGDEAEPPDNGPTLAAAAAVWSRGADGRRLALELRREDERTLALRATVTAPE